MFQNPGSYSDVEKALSVINTIFTGVAVVLGVAEFALGFTALSGSFAVATVLPIVNTVLMGAMFVISIVMLIIHKDPVAPITLLIQERFPVRFRGWRSQVRNGSMLIHQSNVSWERRRK